jgi:hypothetical protein
LKQKTYVGTYLAICKVDGRGMVVHNLNVGVQSNGPYVKFSDFQDLPHLHRIRSYVTAQLHRNS